MSMEQLSRPQLGCVYIILFYLFFSGSEQIISHSFSGCSLHGEACHEAVLFNVEVNYNAPASYK